MLPHADLVDALVHLSDARLGDAAAWLARARHHGVRDVVSAGVDPLLSGAPLSPMGEGPRVWTASGLHPRWVQAHTLPRALEALRVRLAQGGCVAVGEIGLDGRGGSPPAALQEEALVAQLRLARQFGLPAIVHCVRRVGRLLELLEEHGEAEHGVVLHAFAGPAQVVERLVRLNAVFSFGGLLLNSAARRCHEAAARVPDDRLLIETDAPDLDVGSLPRLLEKLAARRGVTAGEVARLTTDNARRVYRMDILSSR